MESVLNHPRYLQSKHKSTLNIECDNLQLKVANMQPYIHDLLSPCQNVSFPFKKKKKIQESKL